MRPLPPSDGAQFALRASSFTRPPGTRTARDPDPPDGELGGDLAHDHPDELGPGFLFPTPTDGFLGVEKFSMGPTIVLLRQQSGLTYGLLFNHLVSIGGTRRTSDVNSTFLQPALSYTTSTCTTLAVHTEATCDWENSKWTFAAQRDREPPPRDRGERIRFSLGPQWYAEGPTVAPDRGLRFAVTLLFPR